MSADENAFRIMVNRAGVKPGLEATARRFVGEYEAAKVPATEQPLPEPTVEQLQAHDERFQQILADAGVTRQPVLVGAMRKSHNDGTCGHNGFECLVCYGMNKAGIQRDELDSGTAGAWPENIVAQRHEVSGEWWLMYLDDQQAALCQRALQRFTEQRPSLRETAKAVLDAEAAKAPSDEQPTCKDSLQVAEQPESLQVEGDSFTSAGQGIECTPRIAPLESKLAIAREALALAEAELFEAADKFCVIHHDLTEHAPDGYKALTRKWMDRASDAKLSIHKALKCLSLDNTGKQEQLGRFGHHPDHAIDFCIEVDCLEGLSRNACCGMDDFDEVCHRVFVAMMFRVGGDEGAVKAKQRLRALENMLMENRPPDQPCVSLDNPVEEK